jgi:hypothetical protein
MPLSHAYRVKRSRGVHSRVQRLFSRGTFGQAESLCAFMSLVQIVPCLRVVGGLQGLIGNKSANDQRPRRLMSSSSSLLRALNPSKNNKPPLG